jgi:Eukaryotic-type carbonic anhydrase
VSEGAFTDLIPGWDAVASATLEKCPSNSSTVSTNGARNRRTFKARNLQGSFNPYALVAKDASFYNYPGSLTTPPCSQGINWNVVDTPVSVSVHEFVAITNFIWDCSKTCTFNASIANPPRAPRAVLSATSVWLLPPQLFPSWSLPWLVMG